MRVRSFSLDLTKSASPLPAATILWQAFCQAAGISTPPAIAAVSLAWAERPVYQFARFLPDVEGEPPVEIVTTDRSRRGYLDIEREVRIRGPRRSLEFCAVLARSGIPALGDSFDVTFTGRLNAESPPFWTLVSASVDFGPAGSLDRAWAVLELFAGWDAETASGWEMDEIADALSEAPELNVAFVEDDEIGPSPISSKLPRIQESDTDRYRHERDALARGIAAAAKRARIYNGDVQLTGPDLLLLLDDMSRAILPDVTEEVQTEE